MGSEFEGPIYPPYNVEYASMGNPERAAELLEVVADRFETGDMTWIQGKLGGRRWGSGTSHTEACFIGGIQFTTEQNRVLVRDQQLAYKASYEAMGSPPMQIADWNDVPGRTLDEVIDVLKHAAKDLRNQA